MYKKDESTHSSSSSRKFHRQNKVPHFFLILAFVGFSLGLSGCGNGEDSTIKELKTAQGNPQPRLQLGRPEELPSPETAPTPIQTQTSTSTQPLAPTRPSVPTSPSLPSKLSPPPPISGPFPSRISLPSRPSTPSPSIETPSLETPSPSPDPHPSYPEPAGPQPYPLAWESVRKTDGKEWSNYTFQIVDSVFQSLDQAKDMIVFCPRYPDLSREEKVNAWGMLISAIVRYEVGAKFNPTSRYMEPKSIGNDGIDEVTHQRVYSEGLLQVSYGDTRWAKFCRFDWSKDQFLAPDDPNKTILNPYHNLHCGVGILARQVARKKLIVLKKGPYWAVLDGNGRHQKISQIAEMVKKIPFCQ